MTDERDRSAPPNQPYSGEPERVEGGMREGGSRDGFPRDPNGQPRQGFQDQDGGGLHRGPRRSRYGRRRGPSDGPGDTGGGGYNQPPRAPEPDLDEGDNFLPSFIAGPSNGGPDQSAGPQGHPSHTPGHGQSPNQGHNPSHQPGHNPSHQPGHNPGHQPGHNPSQYGGGQSGGGYQGQPSHQSHGGPVHQPSHQGGQPGGHQPVHHEPLPPEEPSPEVQAAAAEFAEWEASNPKLRGLLICTPTVKRGEPLVRGTRIPARILAAIAKMGSSVEEMLQDYPALTQEGLDAALAFAKACPRQAR